MASKQFQTRILGGLAGGAILALAVAGCASLTSSPTATANMVGQDGNSIGTARFEQTADGVKITLNVSHLTPGQHAVHIHEFGKCDGAVKFTSAGGHYNPTMKTHGMNSAMPMHAGDMMNQTADASGNMKVTITDKAVTLTDGASSVFDTDGSALVIHAMADDYMSQPAGNAGDRVACGIITKK